MKTIVSVIATVCLTAAVSAAPSPKTTDADRARWTMGDMQGWAIVLGAYQQDTGKSPDVQTIEELQALAQPKYIKAAPTHDAWGNPYRVSKDANGVLRVISAGADGKFDESSWSTGGEQSSFAADAVVTGARGPLFRRWEYW